jgi:geranylgeranyl pyrophosphate synthase
MGGAAGGADATQMKALKRFGACLGVAFQIVDDLLDADDPAKAGEMSILQITDKAGAKQQAVALTHEALDALAALDSADPARAEAVSLLRHLAEDQVSRKI